MAKKAAAKLEAPAPSKRVYGKSPPEATDKKGKSKTSEKKDKKEKKVKNTKVETASTHKVKKDKVKAKPIVDKVAQPKTGSAGSKTKQAAAQVKNKAADPSTKRPSALRKPDDKEVRVTKRNLTEELEKACKGEKKKPASVLKNKLDELRRIEEEASSSSDDGSESTGSMTDHLAALLDKSKPPVTNQENASSDENSGDEGSDQNEDGTNENENESEDGTNDEDSEEQSDDDDDEANESSEEDGQPSQPVTPVADDDNDQETKKDKAKENKDKQSLALVAQSTDKSTALVRNSSLLCLQKNIFHMCFTSKSKTLY